ncbi:MAG: cell envelope integrity protein TolA [Pseudomonadota bacterium]
MIPSPYKKPLIYALVLHLIIALILLFAFSLPKTMKSPSSTTSKTKIIQATTVSAEQVHAQQQAIKAAREKQIKHKEAAHVARQKALAEKRAHALALKKAREKALRQEKEKKAQQLVEQKKKAEQAAIAKEKRIKAAKAAKEKAVAGEVNQYTGMILAAIQNHVYQAICAGQNLSATLSIRLNNNGDAVDVRLSKSSGNATFDRMVESAVKAASPFTLPNDAEARKRMQQLNLLVAPCSG